MEYYIDLSVIKEMIGAALSIINGSCGIIEGIRLIAGLRGSLTDDMNLIGNEVFLIMVGFDSETEHYPLGELRKKYKVEYLTQLDKEMKEFIDESREGIIQSCHELIKFLQNLEMQSKTRRPGDKYYFLEPK